MLLVFRVHDVIRNFILAYFFKPQRLKCNVTCFPRTWRHFPRIIFPYFFKTKNNRHRIYSFQVLLFSKIFIFGTESIFTINTTAVIASKSNHINTMLPNELVLAPLQKLKIKYELFYQPTTRLKYIDAFDHLLRIQQWTSTVDNTVRSLIHFTIFIWYYVVKHFPSLIRNHH
jgi:hypothetical protein